LKAYGVVNFISKTPRELNGNSATITFGSFGRDIEGGQQLGKGTLFGINATHARAVNDQWAYKLSAGGYTSDPYARPTGLIPNGTGTRYPDFVNTGTTQPKFDARVDYDAEKFKLVLSGGYSGTDGIFHTGIGPFDSDGVGIGYASMRYTRGGLKFSVFTNQLNGDATGLLAIGTNGRPILFEFNTKTYDVEIGNINTLGTKNVLSYGGNVRFNKFDLSIAPNGDSRTELGVYVQDEIFFNDKLRASVGARVDKFDNIEDPVFSPRVSVMFKPSPTHSIRASYNRAFVSPSFINNYLNQNISNTDPIIDLTPLKPLIGPAAALVPPPFFLTINAYGNPNLKEQSTDGFELAYTGTFASKTTIGFSVYQTDTDDNINFVTLIPVGTPGFPLPTFYSVTNPARGITVPTPTTPSQPVTLSPILMGILAQIPPQFGGPILLPEKAATYLNLGPIRNRGIEVSVDHRINQEWSANANYSWQDTPEVLDADSGQIPYPAKEVGLPSEHRFNAGIGYSGKKVFGNANVNYAGKALWVDVLGATYAGYTDAYTMLNATLGVKLASEKVTVSLKGINLTNETIQQHVFGDILKRSVFLEARFSF